MTIGDQTDVSKRLQKLVPNGWFTVGLSPVRDAVLAAGASVLSFAYSLLAFVRLQTRIATATGGFLDMIAGDYFGATLLRGNAQTDSSFRAAIIANLFRERGTRKSVTTILTQLTGRAPIIFEPERPADTGSYGASVQVTRSSTATYYDAAGVLRTAAPNVVRYTYNPGALTPAATLLVENAATNLLLNSEALNLWGVTNGTVTINAGTAPDGNVSGDLFVESTTASVVHLFDKGFTAVPNTQYAFSIFLKAAGRSRVLVQFGKAGSPFTRMAILVDLTTGSFTNADVGTPTSVVTRSVKSVGNGWYRVQLAGIFDTTSTDGYAEMRLDNGAGQTYTGDGVSGVYGWGGQVEAGPVATSYIPTTSATVTRAADVIANYMPVGSSGSGGYGVAGGYGSLLLPMQSFVTAYRNAGQGIPNVAGYGASPAGYSVPSQGDYASITQVTGYLSDADLYAAINSVRPVGYVIWTAISS